VTKDPNKNRTEDDFKRQAEMLIEVKAVLTKYKQPAIMSDGIVLGYVRDGDFISWDFDADFFLEAEKVMGLEDHIANEFSSLGYEIITVRGGLNDWKVAIDKYDYHIDLRSFFRVKDMHISKVKRSNGKWSVYTMPTGFMDNLQEIEFRGGLYLIPHDTEGYLTHLYGPDWRIPIRSVKQKEYLNPVFKQEVSV